MEIKVTLSYNIAGITLGFYVDGPKAEHRIETLSEAYPETYFADSSLGLDL